MAIGQADIEALERILDWAHGQALEPRREAAPEAPAHEDMTHEESEEMPDDMHGDDDPDMVVEEVEEMPRASHFGSHRFGGTPAKKPYPGKRK
jgi:hypothetical protein